MERYDPTVEDTYRNVVDVDGNHIVLEIVDTAGTVSFVAQILRNNKLIVSTIITGPVFNTD